MTLWRRIRSFADAISHRSRMESEMNAELRFHLEAYLEDLVRSGIPRDEALRRARMEFGSVDSAKEECREARGANLWDALLRDFRYAVRTLRKAPGFTATAVLTLALGIGANTAIFTAVSTVLLRPLPFPNASQLIDISAHSTLFDFDRLNISLLDLADVRASSKSIDIVTPYLYASSELSGDGNPERVDSGAINEDFFPALGIAAELGHTFTVADVHPDSRSILLSDRLWRQRFGGDPGIVGRSITLDSVAHVVVGVIPALPKTGFVTDDDVWSPLQISDEQRSSRKDRAFSVLARLKPGNTAQQAQKELEAIGARLAAEYPETNKGWSLHATSMESFIVGDARGRLLILFCAVGLVLLIACANVSNLLLSRGLARRREFAIRAALGASRTTLLRQLFVETGLVALAGGACALLVAAWCVYGLRAVLPAQTPRIDEIAMRGDVGWFTLGVSLLAAIFAGLGPSLLNSRNEISAMVKESGGGDVLSGSSRHNFLRRTLVVAEIGLAVVLLIGATLAVQNFAQLIRKSPGFRSDHIVTLHVEFPEFRFAKPEQGIAFVQQVLESTRAIPAVEHASAGLVFPLGDFVAETSFQVERKGQSDASSSSAESSALNNLVMPDFFRTFGIPLLAGRDFNADDRRGNPPVFIVNEGLARKYFDSIDVVGKRMFTRKESGHPVWGQIVGVAGNVRSLRADSDASMQVYEPFSQARMLSGIFLTVRTKAEPLSVVPAIQERIWAIDRDRPVVMVKTMEQQIAEDFAEPRSQSLLLSLFSGLGFVLALIGVYGVMSYLVSQQTREIGIRMALGAARGHILRSVMVHGLKLTVAGVGIGLVVSLVLARFLGSLLFGVSAIDPAMFGGVAVALTVVTVAACLIPAHRATRVDPLTALRHE